MSFNIAKYSLFNIFMGKAVNVSVSCLVFFTRGRRRRRVELWLIDNSCGRLLLLRRKQRRDSWMPTSAQKNLFFSRQEEWRRNTCDINPNERGFYSYYSTLCRSGLNFCGTWLAWLTDAFMRLLLLSPYLHPTKAMPIKK